MSTINLRILDSLHAKAREVADKERISLNQLITLALAEKISALTTEVYLCERARRGDRGLFERAMSKVADAEPEESNQL